jgi:hypothetical protein
LKKLDFLNRDQIGVIHRLGKKHNINRILRELSPYLATFRENEAPNVYFLNKEGREYVNSQKERKKISLSITSLCAMISIFLLDSLMIGEMK